MGTNSARRGGHLRFAQFCSQNDFPKFFASILKIMLIISDKRRIRIEGGNCVLRDSGKQIRLANAYTLKKHVFYR